MGVVLRSERDTDGSECWTKEYCLIQVSFLVFFFFFLAEPRTKKKSEK